MKNLLILLSLFIVFSGVSYANTGNLDTPIQTTYKGVVKEVVELSMEEKKVIMEIANGNRKGDQVETLTGTISESSIDYSPGDKVFILGIANSLTSEETFYITDFDRTSSLFTLFIIFVVVVIVISKKWGVYSLMGMTYSFFIIFKFILPQLLLGRNPLFIAILGALFIAPITFYLSHGLNRKTTVSLISTLITLFITGVLSLVFITISKLTGFGSDEALFLQIAKEGSINMQGIFLAGIIIGTLGILDDVTISQSAIVTQLRNSIRGIGSLELYKKAMEVGHDHIASTVNTLVLVYTGAALPLLLLFSNSSKNFSDAINAEIIADEIVRTLVGSIGLVLAVPISTLLAVYFLKNDRDNHSHNH